MPTPDWWYDDLKQVGLDFADAAQAADYDRRQGVDTAADARLLGDLGVRPGTVMADLGCGTGVMACEAARLGAMVHAVDISPAMLSLAEARAQREGVALHPHHASFLTFNPGEGVLDLVVTRAAFHHLPDFWKAVALRRIWRMLKPGGRLYLRDVIFDVPPQDVPETVEAWITWLSDQSGYTREDGACHVREEHSTFAWIIEGLLREAGFDPVRRVEQTRVYGTYLATKP